MSEVIVFGLHESGVVKIYPRRHLEPHDFAYFLKAVEGFRYDRRVGGNAGPIDRIDGAIRRLREAGFDVDFEEGLRTKLRRYEAGRYVDHHQAAERLERIDAELKATTGFGLFPYQKIGVSWLTLRRAALLADEQGLGKTLQVIIALKANAPVMVVTPATLKGTWVAEFRKWRPHLKVQVLSGRGSFRWPKQGEILVTNFDVLPDVHDREGKLGRKCEGLLPPETCKGCRREWVMTDTFMGHKTKGHTPECDERKNLLDPKRCPGCAPLLKEVAPGTIFVVDEAHKAKGGTSLRGNRCRALSRAAREEGGASWGMTGTPLEGDPKDLWYVFDLCGIAEECFGSYQGFAEVFKGRPKRHGGYAWGVPESSEAAQRFQRGALRRMKADVQKDLPPKIWGEHEVEVDRKALAACDALMKRYGGADQIAKMIEKDTFDFSEISAARKALATAKIPGLLAYLKEIEPTHDDPVVVYSMHRAPIDALGEIEGWATITGDTKNEERQEIVTRFQAGRYVGLAVTIAAAGYGITITRSSRGVFVDRSFKPTENQQAEDRQHRIGTDRTVRYTNLVADHVLDRRLAEIERHKRIMIAAAVDSARVEDEIVVDVQEELRRVQQEISGGRVFRRLALSEKETQAVERLRGASFVQPADDKLAQRLCQEADLLGLSEKQWKLVLDLAAKAEGESGEEFSEGSSDGRAVDGSGPATSEDAGSRPAPSTGEANDDDEEDEMVTEKARQEIEAAAESIAEGLRTFAKLVGPLAAEERVEFLAAVDEVFEEEFERKFCFGCGSDQPEGHECPNPLAQQLSDDLDALEDGIDDLDEEDEDESLRDGGEEPS